MKQTFTARELTMIGFFMAITAILAQMALPLPFTPMPISFGLVAVYITGGLLKPRHAVLAQTGYLLLGAIGIPVFGNFRGGMEALFGPTGGYLLVYPVMAWIVAMALNGRKSRQSERGKGKKWLFLKSAVSICIAHLVIYTGGTVWLSVTSGMPFPAALALAVYPFIPLDVIKIIFCVAVIVPLRARLLAMNLLLLERDAGGRMKHGEQAQ